MKRIEGRIFAAMIVVALLCSVALHGYATQDISGTKPAPGGIAPVLVSENGSILMLTATYPVIFENTLTGAATETRTFSATSTAFILRNTATPTMYMSYDNGLSFPLYASDTIVVYSWTKILYLNCTALMVCKYSGQYTY